MKMKRLFTTLAAMLLVSIGAFAQSGATLKGDANGDGKVDVEDVTSVVDLILSGKTYGYFYFGTTQPTADNYQTLSGVVTSYTSIGEAVGSTASIAEGQTLYMLCPVAWMNGESVKVEDNLGEIVGFSETVDAVTIPGYAIYRTQVWNEASDVTLKTQRNNYYLGETAQETFTITDLTEYRSEKPTSLTVNASSGDVVTVWIYPASWGEPTAMMNLGDNDKSAWTWNPDWLTVPEGYVGAWIQAGSTAPFDLIWKDDNISSIKWKTTTGSSNAGERVAIYSVTNMITVTYSDNTTSEVNEWAINVYTNTACTTVAPSNWYDTAGTYYIKGTYSNNTTTNYISWTVNPCRK